MTESLASSTLWVAAAVAGKVDTAVLVADPSLALAALRSCSSYRCTDPLADPLAEALTVLATRAGRRPVITEGRDHTTSLTGLEVARLLVRAPNASPPRSRRLLAKFRSDDQLSQALAESVSTPAPLLRQVLSRDPSLAPTVAANPNTSDVLRRRLWALDSEPPVGEAVVLGWARMRPERRDRILARLAGDDTTSRVAAGMWDVVAATASPDVQVAVLTRIVGTSRDAFRWRQLLRAVAPGTDVRCVEMLLDAMSPDEQVEVSADGACPAGHDSACSVADAVAADPRWLLIFTRPIQPHAGAAVTSAVDYAWSSVRVVVKAVLAQMDADGRRRVIEAVRHSALVRFVIWDLTPDDLVDVCDNPGIDPDVKLLAADELVKRPSDPDRRRAVRSVLESQDVNGTSVRIWEKLVLADEALVFAAPARAVSQFTHPSAVEVATAAIDLAGSALVAEFLRYDDDDPDAGFVGSFGDVLACAAATLS